MTLRPTLGALAVAMAGAAGWAALLLTAEREMDIMAVVVGVLVGLAAAKLGARTHTDAAVCALLTVGALVGGKAIGAHLLFEKQLPVVIERTLSKTAFELEVEAAKDLGTLSGEMMRPFLADWGHAESDEPSKVTQTELADFEREHAPRLRWLAKAEPPIEAWRQRASAELRARMGNVPFLSMVRAATNSESTDDLLFDILFVLLRGAAAAEGVRRGTAKADNAMG